MTDRELVEEILTHGRREAFGQIVARHTSLVFSRAIGILHDEAEAAEVTQQTFVRAYENLASWRGENLAPWLATIASYTALKNIDRLRRHRHESLSETPQAERPEEPYSDERERRLQQMEQAIAELPEADRKILTLHYYEQLSTAEVARRMGLSQANVLVRLHRIRQRLKEKLKNHGTERD